MQTCEVLVRHPLGLHARVAARIVRIASGFRCNIALVYRGRRASARSIIAVLMLAAAVGASVRVEADGPDEQEAITVMASLVRGDIR
jgi:phosphocarrier protein HPr